MKRQNYTPPEEPTIGTYEVSRISGLSLRQLQWHDERGILQPVHSGHVRFYTQEMLFAACILAHLRRCGVSLQQIRKGLSFLRKHVFMLKEGYLVMMGPRWTFFVDPLGAVKALEESESCRVVLINTAKVMQEYVLPAFRREAA